MPSFCTQGLFSFIHKLAIPLTSKIYSSLLLHFCLCFILVRPIVSEAQTRIMPLGNSITQANTSHNSYRRALWHLLKNNGYSVNFVGTLNTNFGGPPPNPDFDLDHEGHWGWRADRLLQYINQWAYQTEPDIVLLHAGTNDTRQGETISSTVGELGKIIDEIRTVNPQVIILFAQLVGGDSNSRIASLNMEIAKLAAQKNTSQSRIILVNQSTGFNTQTDTYDGIHPNSAGEQKIAGKWFEALKTVLTVGPLPLRTPENPANTANGLDYKYYQGKWNSLPDFNTLTPIETGVVTNFDLSNRNQADNFAFSFSGYIHVPADGVYTFYTASDDGSKLYIGTTQVVNNDGLHTKIERSGKIGLKAGKHAFRVTFFEQSLGQALEVRYQGPTLAKQLIPSTALFRISTANMLSGTYRVTAKHSGKAMQVSNGSTAEGANVNQWTANGTASQLWIIAPIADGYYKITNKNSSKALQVQNSSLSNGGNIQQATYQGAANQQWKIESTGNGYYRITSKLSGKAADVSGASKLDGANIQQWTYSGLDNQQWKLEKLSTARIASYSDAALQTGMAIHPNPVSHILNIKVSSPGEIQAEVVVYNFFSQAVLSTTVHVIAGENLLELNTSSLPNGIYFVNLRLDGQSFTKTVIVSK